MSKRDNESLAEIPVFLSHLSRFPSNFLQNKLNTNYQNLSWNEEDDRGEASVTSLEWLCCFNTIFEKFELQEHDDSDNDRFEYGVSFTENSDGKKKIFKGVSKKSVGIAQDIAASNAITYLLNKCWIPKEIPKPPAKNDDNDADLEESVILIEDDSQEKVSEKCNLEENVIFVTEHKSDPKPPKNMVEMIDNLKFKCDGLATRSGKSNFKKPKLDKDCPQVVNTTPALPIWQYNYLTSKHLCKKENQLRKIIWPVDDIKNWINIFHTQFITFGLSIKFNHYQKNGVIVSVYSMNLSDTKKESFTTKHKQKSKSQTLAAIDLVKFLSKNRKCWKLSENISFPNLESIKKNVERFAEIEEKIDEKDWPLDRARQRLSQFVRDGDNDVRLAYEVTNGVDYFKISLSVGPISGEKFCSSVRNRNKNEGKKLVAFDVCKMLRQKHMIGDFKNTQKSAVSKRDPIGNFKIDISNDTPYKLINAETIDNTSYSKMRDQFNAKAQKPPFPAAISLSDYSGIYIQAKQADFKTTAGHPNWRKSFRAMVRETVNSVVETNLDKDHLYQKIDKIEADVNTLVRYLEVTNDQLNDYQLQFTRDEMTGKLPRLGVRAIKSHLKSKFEQMNSKSQPMLEIMLRTRSETIPTKSQFPKIVSAIGKYFKINYTADGRHNFAWFDNPIKILEYASDHNIPKIRLEYKDNFMVDLILCFDTWKKVMIQSDARNSDIQKYYATSQLPGNFMKFERLCEFLRICKDLDKVFKERISEAASVLRFWRIEYFQEDLLNDEIIIHCLTQVIGKNLADNPKTLPNKMKYGQILEIDGEKLDKSACKNGVESNTGFEITVENVLFHMLSYLAAGIFNEFDFVDTVWQKLHLNAEIDDKGSSWMEESYKWREQSLCYALSGSNAQLKKNQLVRISSQAAELLEKFSTPDGLKQECLKVKSAG